MELHRLTSIARSRYLLAVAVACAGFGSATSLAAPVYLNSSNISVALGASMSAEPFANQTTATSLANVIDAPSADAAENHDQPSHVWVSDGTLELDFDFGIEYDLTMLHFWNYFGESYDVDDLDFTFFDASMSQVGQLLDVEPALGGGGSNPIYAEDYALAFPSKVRFVNVFLSGSNDEVDFNNIGFTGEVSDVPEPGIAPLLLVGAAAGLALRPRSRRSGSS